jgi:hypothetical protein
MLLSMFAPPGAPNPESLINLYSEKKPMNYAMVQDGVVVNIIDWDGVAPYTPPEGCKLHEWEGPVSIGWLWVDGRPIDPTPPPPTSDIASEHGASEYNGPDVL